METINVLVVDDDKEIVNAICKLLESEGYKTLKAYDGLEAIDILTQNTVHLIILDIMMPGISGIETCQKIRNFSYVPILFLTARASESDKVHGFYAGGDDYLTKPFSYVELVARVRALLRRNEYYKNYSIDHHSTNTTET